MANPLKQLAGETAIYGFSSILARVLNFLFVPTVPGGHELVVPDALQIGGLFARLGGTD